MSERVDIQCPACLDAGEGPQLMVIRENGENGSEFLGCPRYPKCKNTMPLPTWVEMERAGAARLPGW